MNKKSLVPVVLAIAMLQTSTVFADTTSSDTKLQSYYKQTAKLNKTAKVTANFDEQYSGSDLQVGRDIPVGEYVIVPNKNKFAYVARYEFGNTMATDTGDRRYTYSTFIEYSDVIKLKEKEYVSINDGVLVPSDKMPKIDISRNGRYRVGTDIPAGIYKFKLDESTPIGYVAYDRLVDNSKHIMYYLFDRNNEITIRLENGMILSKYGVDIYDGTNLKMYSDYSPVTQIYSTTDADYDFTQVRDSFKEKICKEFFDELNQFTSTKKNANRFLSSYVDSKIASWKSLATNNAEVKYVDILSTIYYRFQNFARPTNIDLTKSVEVEIYNVVYTGGQYQELVKSQIDAYKSLASEFSNAKNFNDCDISAYKSFGLYYGMPFGLGTKIK